MRALLVLAACVLAGLAAGGIWTLAQPDRHRADARVLVRPSGERIMPAIEALAESSLVEANVAQTLHLSSPPHVSATRGEGGVLTVSVEAGSRERARQIDAEAVAILTQKVDQRFGATPGVTATLLDPAHAAEQTSPTLGRNVLITGLAGLVVGLVAAAALMRGRGRPLEVDDPHVENRLRTRIDQVAKRERALARRAGELAAREQLLDRRDAELEDAVAKQERDLGRRDRELEQRRSELQRVEAEQAAAAAEAEEAAVPAPPPEVEEPAPALARESGSWTLGELEALVSERAAAGAVDQAQQEEWRTYLFFLREHADADGSLPRSFDGLLADVFGLVQAG